MSQEGEQAPSPDTQQQEQQKIKSELKKLMKVREGRRNYVVETMNDLEQILETGTKLQKQQKKVILWEEFTHLEKLDGKILDLMSEFEEMDIQKEMRQASKIRADMHLGMIQIDETLATTAAIPPTDDATSTAVCTAAGNFDTF